MQLRHLEEAERHIAQGIRHIAEQEQRIAGFDSHGHDMSAEWELLNTFYTTQAQHIQHRDRILRELKE